MYILKSIVLLLELRLICGTSTIGLNNLIEKVYSESGSATLAFVGFDDEFLSCFMKTHSTRPIFIFKAPTCNEDLTRNTILVVKAGEINSSTTKRVLQNLIQKLKVRKFAIVFAENFEQLRTYFEYFREHKFTRIYGTITNTSYAYLNYADDPVQQLAVTTDRPLPNALTDMNGFPIRTTIQTDIPRTFWYENEKGQRKIGGYSGQIFANFIEKHNATFEEVILENSTRFNVKAIIYASIGGDLDISSNVLLPVPGCEYSYPLKMNAYGLMVPLNRNVRSYQYFIRPFSPTVWILLFLTLSYISLMDYLKDFYSCHQADLWQSFSQTFLNMLNLPSRLPTHAYRFHIQVLIFAFIFGNLYTDYFTSFLTVFIKVEQFETFEDLLENNISLMLPYNEIEYMSINIPRFREDRIFQKILFPVDYTTFIGHLNSMRNINYAYTVFRDRAEFLIGWQATFEKPMFRMIEISGEFFQTFLLSSHSQFREILDSFIMRSFETGLKAKWERDTITQAIRAGFERRLNDKVRPPMLDDTPLTVNHFYFAWNCLVFGWLLAGAVFFFEISGKAVWKIFGTLKKYPNKKQKRITNRKPMLKSKTVSKK